MTIYAVIPARSGSKSVPDKNIRKILGIELMGYSIALAKDLKGIDRILCSTDSEHYAETAVSFGAEVPFLRSKEASGDNAMEEDILRDFHDCFERVGMEKPDLLVWLRPTFLFRDREKVQRCIDRMKGDEGLTACRFVCAAEGRLYRDIAGVLEPVFDDKGASMARRQDTGVIYSVYNTDVFPFPATREMVHKDFLGRTIGYEVGNKICSLDIDDSVDFELVRSIMENNPGLVKDFIPSSLGSGWKNP